MTAPSQTPRVLSPSASSSSRGLGSTRSLFIAVAVLGLGGAAAGWLLTHSNESSDLAPETAAGTVVDPLAPPATATITPTSPLGMSVTAPQSAAGTPTAGTAAAATGTTPATAGVATPGTPATPANPGQAAPLAAPAVPAGQLVQQSIATIATDPVRARAELTRLLDSNTLSAAERAAAYQGINTLAEQLLFSPRIVPGDTVSQSYLVKKGDSLARIAKRENLNVDWRFVQRINAMSSERALRPDMRLKLVYGPFHAEVVKADFRFNIYSGQGADRVMVASLPCGLGENDGTPVGTFKVRAGSKNINPEWRNPRTGEYFGANDPKNPIGERWIGIMGATPETARFTGFGIHGTVDPTSIGRNASMGCVRLGDAEVQVAYELIGDDSMVVIR